MIKDYSWIGSKNNIFSEFAQVSVAVFDLYKFTKDPHFYALELPLLTACGPSNYSNSHLVNDCF